MAAALNIAALARRTGVQPDTLRKWEHRYGVIRPERTSGGQRRYSELDVARVEWLKARLAEGYRIGEAAALLGSVDLAAVPHDAEELAGAIYDAVLASEAAALERLVEQSIGVLGVERALAEVFVPVLRRVGEGWAAGDLSVAQEHLASGVFRGHLSRLAADMRGAIRGVVVLACAPGERHELGLLMLAVMLRADGWQVAYLGADTPLEDAAALARDLQASVLGISVSMASALTGLGDVRVENGTRLVVGGRAVTPAIARKLGAAHADGDLAELVAAFRKL